MGTFKFTPLEFSSFITSRFLMRALRNYTFFATLNQKKCQKSVNLNAPNNCMNSIGKGGKNRRRGKNENETEKRELIFKEDGQEYAQVLKMLGNGRLEAMCFDGVKRLCHIRGKLRKKVC